MSTMYMVGKTTDSEGFTPRKIALRYLVLVKALSSSRHESVKYPVERIVQLGGKLHVDSIIVVANN